MRGELKLACLSASRKVYVILQKGILQWTEDYLNISANDFIYNLDISHTLVFPPLNTIMDKRINIFNV